MESSTLREGNTLIDLAIGEDHMFRHRIVSSDDGSPESPVRRLHQDALNERTNGFYKRKELMMRNKTKYLRSLEKVKKGTRSR